jgi:hypothetical protein
MEGQRRTHRFDRLRALLLRRVQSFFELRRSKNRHTALRLPGMRFFRIAATISSNVKSGCSTISPNSIPQAAKCCRHSAWPQRCRFLPTAAPKSPPHSG